MQLLSKPLQGFLDTYNILKFMCKGKGSEIAKTILKNNERGITTAL